MNLGVISVRYARALLKEAVIEHQEDVLYAEMQTLLHSYFTVHELKIAVDSPMLSNEEKQNLLELACGGKVCALTQKFIRLILKKNRGELLQFMAASYVSIYRELKHITLSLLTTASPVDLETEQKVKQLIESYTHGEVEFSSKVDTDLIGGFILEYDSYRMDASVQTKLRKVLSALNG